MSNPESLQVTWELIRNTFPPDSIESDGQAVYNLDQKNLPLRLLNALHKQEVTFLLKDNTEKKTTMNSKFIEDGYINIEESTQKENGPINLREYPLLIADIKAVKIDPTKFKLF